jgi:hypothetical protein
MYRTVYIQMKSIISTSELHYWGQQEATITHQTGHSEIWPSFPWRTTAVLSTSYQKQIKLTPDASSVALLADCASNLCRRWVRVDALNYTHPVEY